MTTSVNVSFVTFSKLSTFEILEIFSERIFLVLLILLTIFPKTGAAVAPPNFSKIVSPFGFKNITKIVYLGLSTGKNPINEDDFKIKDLNDKIIKYIRENDLYKEQDGKL